MRWLLVVYVLHNRKNWILILLLLDKFEFSCMDYDLSLGSFSLILVRNTKVLTDSELSGWYFGKTSQFIGITEKYFSFSSIHWYRCRCDKDRHDPLFWSGQSCGRNDRKLWDQKCGPRPGESLLINETVSILSSDHHVKTGGNWMRSPIPARFHYHLQQEVSFRCLSRSRSSWVCS